MHITQRGDKLKILQKPHRASSQWHTKTHGTEYLESLACDHSLIGWKLWHHKGRREQNHLPSCTHRATQVSFLSGSTFKTQRCHKWLQTGWKKIEGWQRKSDAYCNEFTARLFYDTFYFFRKSIQTVIDTHINTIDQCGKKSTTSIKKWYWFRQYWIVGNWSVCLVFVDDNSISVDLAVPGYSDVKNQIIISSWTPQICLFYGALFHYSWMSHSGKIICSATRKKTQNIQMDK